MFPVPYNLIYVYFLHTFFHFLQFFDYFTPRNIKLEVNMNFYKLLPGAMLAFGLFACSDDSSSSPKEEEGSVPIVIPTQSDDIIEVSEMKSRVSGDDVKFVGTFNLSHTDTTSQNSEQLQFDSLAFSIGKGSDANNLLPVLAKVETDSNFNAKGQTSIDLNSKNSAGISVNLNDIAFTECGTYTLIVTAFATDGVKQFSKTVTIPFERDNATYCKEPEPEPEPEQEIAMIPCQVELSTHITPGLNLATCTGVPLAESSTADIIFAKAGTKKDPEMQASSGTGLLFAVDDSGFMVNLWPESQEGRTTAYFSDFKFKGVTSENVNEMIMNESSLYIAKAPVNNLETAEGYYVFAIMNPKQENNGDFTFTVKLYKAQ